MPNEHTFAELNPPARLLLGPGPSNVHPRIYRAMSAPVIGYLDPDFLQLLDDTQRPLRAVFRTDNEWTIALSGTGSAGMEACIYNVVEPGDKVLVCINGFFGTRMVEMAHRAGAEVVTVTAPWGNIIEPKQIEDALKANPGVKLVAIVQAETSTGVFQPLEEIARIVHEHDALLMVDAVTSLGGCELEIDAWDIDICYSATQKCLSAPPGLSPVTFGPRAVRAITGRKTPVRSWYLDVALLLNYWGSSRVYHHTPPMTMLYGLREALRLILEEGLDERITRHRRNAEALWAGLQTMGLRLHAQEGYRLPCLTTVRIPEGVQDRPVRLALLDRYGIEIGGGLGDLAGKVWRIGLMGYSSTAQSVLLVLSALGEILRQENVPIDVEAGLAAAHRALSNRSG